MFDFAENVTMTREEWLAVNRALSGASLGMRNLRNPAELDRRTASLKRVRDAQNIMSEIHQRANS